MNPDHDQQDDQLEAWLQELTQPVPMGGRPLLVPDQIEPVKPMPSGWTFGFLAVAAVIAVSALWIAVLGTRGLRLMTGLQIAIFAGIGAVLLAILARWFYQEAKPGSRVLVTAVAAMAAIGAGAGGFLLLAFVLRPDWPHFLTSGLVCLGIGTVSSLVAGWTLARLAAMGFAVDPRRASWAAGGLATLTGWIVLQIYCPKQEMTHLATWHGAALVAGAATVAAFARSRFTPRA